MFQSSTCRTCTSSSTETVTPSSSRASRTCTCRTRRPPTRATTSASAAATSAPPEVSSTMSKSLVSHSLNFQVCHHYFQLFRHLNFKSLLGRHRKILKILEGFVMILLTAPCNGLANSIEVKEFNVYFNLVFTHSCLFALKLSRYLSRSRRIDCISVITETCLL